LQYGGGHQIINAAGLLAPTPVLHQGWQQALQILIEFLSAEGDIYKTNF
jgi:hypothetical protein